MLHGGGAGVRRGLPGTGHRATTSSANFPFAAGGSLAELKLHYRTIGQARKDSGGRVVNAVLVLHGTTGSGAQFLRPEFAGELFGAGQLLDAATHFIVIVDNLAALWRHLLAELLAASGTGP